MKALIFACALFVSAAVGKSQTTFTDPILYNDYIVDQQFVVGDAINIMMGSNSLDSASLWTAYHQSIVMVKQCNENIKKMTAFEGDDELLKAAQALFQYYENAFVNDYPKLIAGLLLIQPTEADFAAMTAIIEQISAEESRLDEKFAIAQSAFAVKHGFTLDESTFDTYEEEY